MARGSSYGGEPIRQSPAVTTSTKIPRRATATRVIQTAPVDESELETRFEQPATLQYIPANKDYIEHDIQIIQSPKSRSKFATKGYSEPEAQTRRSSKPRRTSATKDYSEPEAQVERLTEKRSEPGAAATWSIAAYLTNPSHPLTRHRSWIGLFLLSSGIVLIGSIVLITAAMYLRGPVNPHAVNYVGGQSFPIELGGSSDAFNLWNNSTGPIPAKTAIPTMPPGSYTVLGKPTITADFINEVLASYHSPTAGMGQSLRDLGVKYGIDPVYPLAFFMHESLFGTTGEARVTLSLGNSRCIQDRPCVNTQGTACQAGQSCYAQMYSWQDGFEQWYKLIRNLYVAQWGRVTVDQIIPKYAPNSDGNNEAAYIAALKHTVDLWRAGIVRVS